MTEQERTLIAGCVRGDKASWDAFVLQYSNLVYHSIKKTFSLYHADPDSVLVEDLYQEFFVAILRDECKKLRQFRGDDGCTLASWVRVVAVRLAIDHLRRQKSAADELGGQGGDGGQDADPVTALITHDNDLLLMAAVEKLSVREQLFINLCFFQGHEPQEIAGVLKMSVNAVYTQKSRVLAKLREILQKSSSL